MQPEKIWIVLILLVVLLVGGNLLALAMVRGMRGFKTDGFKSFSDAAKPWKKEDEGLRELSKRVKELKSKEDDEE